LPSPCSNSNASADTHTDIADADDGIADPPGIGTDAERYDWLTHSISRSLTVLGDVPIVVPDPGRV